MPPSVANGGMPKAERPLESHPHFTEDGSRLSNGTKAPEKEAFLFWSEYLDGNLEKKRLSSVVQAYFRLRNCTRRHLRHSVFK